MGVSVSRSVRMAVTSLVGMVVVAMVVVVMVMLIMVLAAGGTVMLMRSVMCHPFRDP